MEINISRITIVLTNGTDKVSLYTNLPNPFPETTTKDNLYLDFSVTHDTGLEYVRKVFNMEPEVINARSKMPKFGKTKKEGTKELNTLEAWASIILKKNANE